MTKEEILAMKPGRELNMKAAEAVFGHEVILDEIFGDVERYIDRDGKSVYAPLRCYSEDGLAAQLVVDRMIGLGHENARFWEHRGKEICSWAEAICKVALLAMLTKEDRLNDKRKKA